LKSRPSAHGRRVLIIDDDNGFVVAARLALRRAGYTVGWCDSAAAAVERVREFRPDVIVLDVMMETGSAGFHVVSQIRDDPGFTNAPILVCTGIHSTTRLRFSPEVDGELLPVQKVIDKPVPTATLVEEVAVLCGEPGRVPRRPLSDKED
jgi:two-component system OmpR family response regulator